jgi:hypothetical protein
LFLGHFSHGLFVRNHHLLSREYFSSRQFYIRDVLSIIPTDILYLIPRCRFVSIIRSNRFLRINRLSEFQELTESRTNFPNTFRIAVLVCLTLTLIHWYDKNFRIPSKNIFFLLGIVVLIFLFVNIWASEVINGYYLLRLIMKLLQCFIHIVSIGQHSC